MAAKGTKEYGSNLPRIVCIINAIRNAGLEGITYNDIRERLESKMPVKDKPLISYVTYTLIEVRMVRAVGRRRCGEGIRYFWIGPR